MKIIFTGGGTGGHFYPIISIIDALKEEAKVKKLIEPELYYMADTPYNARELYDRGVLYKKISAGKIRKYFSILNFTDLFKTFIGVIKALFSVFFIFPDVVFGKGGYSSFPPLLAARILRIPVIIHESDTVPGKVNLWASKFAKKIAVSWPEAVKYFPEERTAWTGNPIRKNLMNPLREGAHEYLNLKSEIPTIFILGGSQGAKNINDVLIEALPDLLPKYQIIHEAGAGNYDEVKNLADSLFKNNPYYERYKVFNYLNELAMRMSAGASDLVISRAGSTIFEIASWGLPSIIIPISESISHDQTKNAMAYGRSGACVIIEDKNLTNHILTSEIDRLINNSEERKKMSEMAKSFAKNDAALKIAEAIISVALKHEE